MNIHTSNRSGGRNLWTADEREIVRRHIEVLLAELPTRTSSAIARYVTQQCEELFELGEIAR